MTRRPILSRIAETAALILMWPIAITATACYLVVTITLEMAVRVLGVWE